MEGKSLVLTLDNKDLQVSVHPEFPKQPLTIAIELDKDGQHGFWVLGESTEGKRQEALGPAVIGVSAEARSLLRRHQLTWSREAGLADITEL